MLDRLTSLPSLTGTPPPWPTDPPDDPVALFRSWFEAAVDAGIAEPHAMTLATVDAAGAPDARVLILKDLTARGEWCFAGSVDSPKGEQLGHEPRAALVFSWSALGRSVRVRGTVRPRDAEASADDFRRRGEGARAIALVGGQSRPTGVPGGDDDAVAEARRRIVADPHVVAASWRLWALTAERVEFWQADPARRHRRWRYSCDAHGWTRQALAP